MNAKVNTVKEVVKEVVKGPTPAELFAKYGTKSATIRALHAQGMTRSQISKATGLIYQHVRNVLITPVKKAKEVAPAVQV